MRSKLVAYDRNTAYALGAIYAPWIPRRTLRCNRLKAALASLCRRKISWPDPPPRPICCKDGIDVGVEEPVCFEPLTDEMSQLLAHPPPLPSLAPASMAKTLETFRPYLHITPPHA